MFLRQRTALYFGGQRLGNKSHGSNEQEMPERDTENWEIHDSIFLKMIHDDDDDDVFMRIN